MPWFEINVQYRSGEPASGRRVSCDYNFESKYTDSKGKVSFSAGRNPVKLYVDGQDKGDISPGTTVVTLR
jgi:hypothetical protein